MQHSRGPRPRLLTLSPALLALAACQPVPPTPGVTSLGDDDSAGGGSLVRVVPGEPGVTLVFPPVADDRHARPTLDIKGLDGGDGDSEAPLAVRWPTLEDDGSFEVEGQHVRLRFNRAVKLPAPIVKGKPVAARAGTLKIEPAVAGKAVWLDGNTLEFQAKKPFDPEAEYQITVEGVATSDGRALTPWQAKFTAEPRIEIAGKTITYLPTPGSYGVINAFPEYGGRVAPDASMFVVFDQPVNLKRVERMISLAYKDGEAIPFVLSHLPTGRFDGHTVNPRQVVEVKPAAPMRDGAEFTLTATGDRDDDSIDRAFDVAGMLELAGVSCGYA